MAVLMTPPYLQFFDANGNVLAGGKVNTYTATGTFSTRKATYTTEAGDVAHPNPVILDAAGRPATGNGSIWLSGTYDFVVTDANDVVIESTLNVTAFTALPSSSDAYFETFSGTGIQTAFTTSEDLGADEKAIYVWVNDGLQEAVTNGTFATDTGWTKGTGWTIGSGVATATGGISTAIEQTAAITLVEGQAYSVSYTITRSAGTLTPSVGGTSGTAQNSSGTHTEVIVAGSNQTLAFTGTGFTGTLDNVSITQAVSSGYSIQSPTTYTINGTTLTFATAPAAGTNNIYVSAPSLLVGAASSAAADAAVSAAEAAASAVEAGAFAGQLTIVSTTSLAIGTGSKVFTVGADLSLNAGQFILIVSDANAANYMWGTIASYSGTTLTVTVEAVGGSGTLNDWTMYLTGERGETGATGSISDLSGVPSGTVTGADKVIFEDVDDASATKSTTVTDLLALAPSTWTLLETQTASASATIDFTSGIDSSYKNYKIIFSEVLTSADGALFRLQTGNGGVFDSGASDYMYSVLGFTNSTSDSDTQGSNTHIPISPSGVGTATGEGVQGELTIFNPSGTSMYKGIHCSSINIDSTSATPTIAAVAGFRKEEVAIDRVRFLMSSGNIASGTFKLYGIL
jgi:hypothetical protein